MVRSVAALYSILNLRRLFALGLSQRLWAKIIQVIMPISADSVNIQKRFISYAALSRQNVGNINPYAPVAKATDLTRLNDGMIDQGLFAWVMSSNNLSLPYSFGFSIKRTSDFSIPSGGVILRIGERKNR